MWPVRLLFSQSVLLMRDIISQKLPVEKPLHRRFSVFPQITHSSVQHFLGTYHRLGHEWMNET